MSVSEYREVEARLAKLHRIDEKDMGALRARIPPEKAERLRLELIEAFAEVGLDIELTRKPFTEADVEEVVVELPGAQRSTLRKVLNFTIELREGDVWAAPRAETLPPGPER